jgi:site-specific recombinase XerC
VSGAFDKGLRRDRATKLWRETGNLVLVNHLLNHGSITTTMRYIGVDTRDLAVAMEQTDLADSRHGVAILVSGRSINCSKQSS